MPRAASSSVSIEPDVLARWRLEPVEALAGRRPRWLVTRGGERLVLSASPAPGDDTEYELAVAERLHEFGWPVPHLQETPIICDGHHWSLVTWLTGSPTTIAGRLEQRRRGRLLAELHEATATLSAIGQHPGSTRTDAIVRDPDLVEAVRRYEARRPDIGHLMRWHLDRALEELDELVVDAADELVIHGDFAPWNLLYEGDRLSGLIDFETVHLDFRVADFALSWRGAYDDVIHGYEARHRLSELDRRLLVPVYWAWLFRGAKDEICDIMDGGRPDHGFEWQASHLVRRSPLFGALGAPYTGDG